MLDDVSADVLVVGAGPTGLAMAASLAKYNIKVRAIDSNAARSHHSKALGVQAGTLEALDQVFGAEVVGAFLDVGFPTYRAVIHLGQNAPITVDLSRIPSQHNFILIIEQSETERILEGQLAAYGLAVGRKQELVALEDTGSFVSAKVRHHDGQIETVTARYVVGCDGAHSSVRKLLDLPFTGGSYEGNFLLADAKVEWPWEYDAIRTFVSDRGVMACFPMCGEQRYRLIIVSHALPVFSGNEDLALEEFEQQSSLLAHAPLKLSDAEWLTSFRVHHRMTRSFRKGRCFLAGDAAHIHSPAGGQGMNTGIQDAFNLAHKLTLVLRQDAPTMLLDRYERERIPVAKRVLRSTDFVFRQALSTKTWLSKALRRFVIPKIVGSRWVQYRIAQAMSQVKVARRDIKLRLRS